MVVLGENQRVMMEAMDSRNEKLEEIMQLLKNNSSRNVEAANAEESDLLPNMPFTDIKSFLTFDRNLKKNPAYKKQFVNKIAMIGGKTPQKAVSNIKKKIVMDELCRQITWFGTNKEKIAMKEGKLPDIIFEVLRRPRYKLNIQLDEFEGQMKTFLRTCGDRIRNERRKTTAKEQAIQARRDRENALLSNDVDDTHSESSDDD
ncbi:uncharacterized protein [Chelonus insularis]|uniref:uncharacterized protein n=1 Tax=Chelonus insularis TaxID=460826 RepID=UPI00158EB0FE|nr:uncharacterized protein LOC118071429 [Chelonus insularis]